MLGRMAAEKAKQVKKAGAQSGNLAAVVAEWTRATDWLLAQVACVTADADAAQLAALKKLKTPVKALGKSLDKALKHAHSGGHADEVALPEVLKTFPLLKNAAGATAVTGAGGAKVRPVVAALQADPESGAALQVLDALAGEVTTAHQAEIDARLADKDLFAKSAEVIATGNEAFVEIYNAVGHLIELSEPGGVAECKRAAEAAVAAAAANHADPAVAAHRAELGRPADAPPRNPRTLSGLCQASARGKSVLDGVIQHEPQLPR